MSVFKFFTSDKIKIKQKKGKKSKKAADELEEMEDEKIQYDDEILDYDKDINFDDMNLSRPLLKVSTCVLVHSFSDGVSPFIVS